MLEHPAINDMLALLRDASMPPAPAVDTADTATVL